MLQVTERLSILEIDRDSFVMWNHFAPILLKLNSVGVDFINNLKKEAMINITEHNKSIIELLLKYKIVFNDDEDSFKNVFIKSINSLLNKIDNNAKDFYEKQMPYSNFLITNDICNLKCPYCVNKYKNPYSPQMLSLEEKRVIVDKAVDQFFLRAISNGVKNTKVSFNGGEILLEWPLIKATIEKISREYRDINVEYSMNTNMTLMNKEIAVFLNRHKFKVFISIDGYKEAHNKTRKFKNNKGSFDHIIKRLKIFRKYSNYFIKGFQGTIEHPDEFDPLEVYELERYGFEECRLAPNLLNISAEDAIKKAQLVGEFIDLNAKHKMQVTEVYFDNMTKMVDLDNYVFYFNCRGLSSYPEIQFNINISTMRATQLCSFIPSASLPMNEIDYNIYHAGLWEHTSKFVKARVNAFFENCLDCELVAICRGGCIYTGLDNENKLNEAACTYQKELWSIYVKKAHEDSK